MFETYRNMKRKYFTPAIKVRKSDRIMLDLSSSEGGDQLGKEDNFDFNDDNNAPFGIVPTTKSVWDESDEDKDLEK